MSFPDQPRSVITGAASGLGRALSLALARRRARLLLSDVNQPALAEVGAAAEAAGATEVVLERVDVGRLEEVERLREKAYAELGGVDLVVNNAGVAASGPVGEVPIEDWRWQIDVNLWGVIHGCHVFVPPMRAAGQGYILNVASAAGLLSAPYLAPYNVSKAGVVALTRTMAAELRRTGVSVSVLCPTFFRSSIHAGARTTRPELRRAAEKRVARASWSAEQVAEVALRGLERGRLHILPQLDARVFWQLQRLWPSGVQRLLGALRASGALLGRGADAGRGDA